VIHVHDLRFTYRKASAPTLHGLDFDIAEREIFGFLGPSGSGKSTTQKILIGLLPGYDGDVQVMGRDLRTWGNDLYEHVGVSFETPNHHQRLTALENLRHFGALFAGPLRDAEEVLAWVGLDDAVDRPVSAFSKGMKIRLNVARSLLHRPKLLFLDEPTAGLDPVNATAMRDLVLRLRDEEGLTVFLTTHDMHVADTLCDRVGFLAGGRLRVIDAPETLKRAHGERSVRVRYERDHDVHEAEFPLDDLADNTAFLDAIRHRVEAIHSLETTLEQVFIDVTGEELRA